MKIQLFWLGLGIVALLLESSLFFWPWLIVLLWLATKYLPLQRVIWAAVIGGIILDSLSVGRLGSSSLILVTVLAVFWLERKLFTALQAIDFGFLLLACFFWTLWRGQPLWGIVGAVAAVLVGVKLFEPRDRGVVLRRL